tara:strand:+ start:1026 stop:1511 length:486 start_codon:yes stop_codon:yes gene_type:complete
VESDEVDELDMGQGPVYICFECYSIEVEREEREREDKVDEREKSLYQFGYSNSDEYSSVAIFQAVSKEKVASYILSQLRKHQESPTEETEKFFRPFIYGFVFNCCREERIYWGEEKEKEILEFLIEQTPSEFLKILEDTHTHSGGDIYEYRIQKLEDPIIL